jgi:hypothetical protein
MVAPDLMQKAIQADGILDLFRLVGVRPFLVMFHCTVCCGDEMNHGSVSLVVLLTFRASKGKELLFRPAAIQSVGQRIECAPVAEDKTRIISL